MNKKKVWAFISLVTALVLSTVCIYWFFFSKPASLPTNEQLIEEINSVFPEAAAGTIQDTIRVDERHVLVPFISIKNDYSLSYWVWGNHKWRVESIDSGEPMIWKIDRNDPSTFYFVWNMHPEDQLSYMDFYLIRDRGYDGTEGMEHYTPRVQMEKKASLQESSYGSMKLPDDWVTFLNSLIKVESAKQTNGFLNNFFLEESILFGWIPYNHGEKETFPERSGNGNGYSTGNLDKGHVMILNKVEIETSEFVK